MTVEEILNDKLMQLKDSNGMTDAAFSKSDIDVLMDINNLRVFKLKNPMPEDFKFADSKAKSIQFVLDGNDQLYRILEYCVITQPVLQIPVHNVYKNWRFINGKYRKLGK